MKSQIIITDGIINEDMFNKQQTRLLWILKEANDTTSIEGWDIRKFLRDRRVEDEGLFHYSKWRSTFGLICKVSHGILDRFLDYDTINAFDDEKLADILDKIAYINIKKTAGGSVVDYEVFNKYVNKPENVELVRKQIRQINPKIVICGNTFHYLFSDLKGFDRNKDWLYIHDGIKYVNGWHTNAKISHEKYFNELREKLNL